MSLCNAVRHFRTITKHKWLVMKSCFAVGLFRQGLLHDLSKYSPEEFITGMQYYQGNKSPNAVEREEKGYSGAWLRHKGRNKHHFEYWIDFASGKDPAKRWTLAGNPMPLRYLIEMVLDRIAACKVYRGEEYTDACAWNYYSRGREYVMMHPQTQRQLERLLQMLEKEGEEKTFSYMRALLWRSRIRSWKRLLHKSGKE